MVQFPSARHFHNSYLNLSSYQVTASSWLNDLRDQVERTRVLNVVYRSATALGSRLPSIASAKARVAGAGALLRPVSSSTQVNLILLLFDLLINYVCPCWLVLLLYLLHARNLIHWFLYVSKL